MFHKELDKDDNQSGGEWTRLSCEAELTLLVLIPFFMYFVTANAIDHSCH